MSWLSIILILGFEYFPTQNYQISSEKEGKERFSAIWGEEENTIKNIIGYRIEIFDIFYLQNVLDTYGVPYKYMLTPYHTDYFFTTGAKFNLMKNIKIDLGYEHLCRHPELTATFNFNKMYGGYDKFFLKTEIKLQ